MRFLDTNILLYAVSTATEEESKAKTALHLLEQDDWSLSVQVLQEFYVQATRATRSDRLPHAHAVALIESWLRFRVQETTVPVLQGALALRERYGLSFWDCTILSAARTAGCREVYSEDLSPEHDYEGVRVINPFR
jgi:predicted nucleic acid-binding protein